MKSAFGTLLIVLLLSPPGDAGTFLEDVMRYYREEDRARNSDDMTGQYQLWRMSLEPVFTSRWDIVPVCAGCPPVFQLSREVNDILRHMAADDPENDQDNLLEEVGNLEALYYVVHNAETEGNPDQIRCEKHRLPGNIMGEDWTFDADLAEIVFRQNVDLSHIGAMQIHNGENRTYIYRGQAEERNLVVRVDVDPQGEARVTYYPMDQESLDSEEARERDRRRRNDRHNNHTLGEMESYSSYTDDQEYFRARYGFGIRMKNGRPEDLLILDMAGSTRLSDKLILRGEVMATAREAFARMGLTDVENNEYIYLSFDRSGVLRTGVPFQVGRGPSNEARGEISVSTREVSARVETTLGGVHLGTTSTRFSYDETRFSAAHEVGLNENIRMSLRYDHQPWQDTELTDNVVWFRLEARWD